MIYVTSDLHGLEITKLKALLKKACFNENDRLFVLGDVIDRQNCYLTSRIRIFDTQNTKSE